MAAMVVREKYLDTLRVFGDVEQQLDTAVEEYVTRRIIERIKSARERVLEFETRYGMAYSIFAERVQLDEAFYDQISQANLLWEQEALEWMYWDKEIQHWSRKLNDILNKS